MSSEAEALKSPPQVKELWMLWNAGNGGHWIVSLDDAPGGETQLCCLSKPEAEAAAKYQNEMYGLDCVPVRVK